MTSCPVAPSVCLSPSIETQASEEGSSWALFSKPAQHLFLVEAAVAECNQAGGGFSHTLAFPVLLFSLQT